MAPSRSPPQRTTRIARRGLWIPGLLVGLLWAGGVAHPEAAAAQQGVRLTVLDDETGEPIPGAIVKIRNRRDLTTSDDGRVLLDSLPVGRVDIEVRAIGFQTRYETLTVSENRYFDKRLGLGFTGQQLPEIVVDARREKLSGRYQDFHRRMASGGGHFIMWDEIKKRGYLRLGEALKGVRGVQVHCRNLDCQISMSRSRSCPPSIFVDGMEAGFFGANTPIRDVYGIEVYRGSAEMPAEYVGESICGAVVIWTKNRPYR